MNDPEDAVTRVFGLAHDAKAVDVGQARETRLLLLHLAPDRVGPFLAPADLRGDSGCGDRGENLRADERDQVAAVVPELDESPKNRCPRLRVQHFEREILKLLADRLHAHASGQRRIDLHRLAGNALPLVGSQMSDRLHVVQPVGQLDEQDPYIAGHREQQFAEVLGLRGFLGGQFQLVELGHAIDQTCDLGAEQPDKLLARRGSVFDRVVQQRRDDGGIVQPEIREDRGDFERVPEIRLSARTFLVGVRPCTEHIGAVQKRFVGVRIVLADPLDKFVLPDHPRSRSTAATELLAVIGHERTEQLFFVEIVGGRSHLRGGRAVPHQRGHAVFFGLVDFDVALVALDRLFHEIRRRDRDVRDFAQRDDRVLVVVAIDGQLCAGRDGAGAVRRQNHEIEVIGNLFDAVFNGHAGHVAYLFRYLRIGKRVC